MRAVDEAAGGTPPAGVTQLSLMPAPAHAFSDGRPVRSVADFLEAAHLGEYAGKFAAEGIDQVEDIFSMDEESLKALGMKWGHWKRFLRHASKCSGPKDERLPTQADHEELRSAYEDASVGHGGASDGTLNSSTPTRTSSPAPIAEGVPPTPPIARGSSNSNNESSPVQHPFGRVRTTGVSQAEQEFEGVLQSLKCEQYYNQLRQARVLEAEDLQMLKETELVALGIKPADATTIRQWAVATAEGRTVVAEQS